jgi:hypothetical protein
VSSLRASKVPRRLTRHRGRTSFTLYHVPFDELTTGDDAEASLLRAIQSSERAAVVGRGGQGKSSLIAHATRARVGIAPFRVPIFVEPDKTVTDPKTFAQYLICTLTTSATQSGLISPEQREAALRASSDRVHILGEEVAHTRAPRPRSSPRPWTSSPRLRVRMSYPSSCSTTRMVGPLNRARKEALWLETAPGSWHPLLRGTNVPPRPRAGNYVYEMNSSSDRSRQSAWRRRCRAIRMTRPYPSLAPPHRKRAIPQAARV